MTVLKIASHYVLTADRGLQRWPVLSLDEEGRVLSLEFFSEGFKEEPFVQFYGGILVPGFIDVIGSTLSEGGSLSCNLHFARGTLVLGIEKKDESSLHLQHPPFVVPYRVPQRHDEAPWLVPDDSGSPIWERMKAWALDHPSHPLEKMLLQATAGASDLANMGSVGAFLPGNFPGVLVLQNADLKEMRLTDRSSVRWLSVPGHFVRPY